MIKGKSIPDSWGYVFIFLVVLCGAYFMLQENTSSLSTLFAGLGGLLFVGIILWSRKAAIYTIILFAPLSLPLSFDLLVLKISFPAEITTFLLILSASAFFFIKEKYNPRILFHPLSILLLADIAVTIYATALSSMPAISFKRALLKTAFIIVYFFIFAHFFDKQKNKNIFFFLYSIGLLYPIFHTLKMHSFQDFSVATSFAMCQPFFADHTIYGACLAFVLPFLFSWITKKENRKKFSWFPIVLMFLIILVALVFSFSRASWISLIGVFIFSLFILLRIKTRHFFTIIGIITILVIANFQPLYQNLRDQEVRKEKQSLSNHLQTSTNLQTDASNLERINRWVCAWRMFKEKPLRGYGPGTYQFQYGQFQSVDYMTRISTHQGTRGHAHSEYLGALSETGIWGLITLLGIIFWSIHAGLRNLYFWPKKSQQRMLVSASLLGLITFFIHGLFNGFLDYEKMAVLVYGSMALLVICDLERKQKGSEKNGTEKQ